MRASPYLLIALLAVCSTISISAYANPNIPAQPASSVSQPSSTSSLSSPPRGNQNGKGFSGGGNLKPVEPPLPPVPSQIPEPDIFLDLGLGLGAFATIWSFRMRRSR